MAFVYKNRAQVATSTTGTGTVTLGSATAGYQTFADAGVADGDTFRYLITDGDAWEIGTGTYTASGTTMARSVEESSNSDALLNLTGSAIVSIIAAGADMGGWRLREVVEPTSDVTAMTVTGLSTFSHLKFSATVQENDAGETLSVQIRASGGTWRNCGTLDAALVNGAVRIFSGEIFGLQSDLVQGYITDSGPFTGGGSNLDRSNDIKTDNSADIHTFYNSYNEAIDEFRVVCSGTNDIEGSTADNRSKLEVFAR